MKYSMLLAAGLALVALFPNAGPAVAQSKEVLASRDVQREVFALESKVEAFHTNQAERMSSLEAMVNQLITSNRALAANLEEMKSSVRQSLNDQQSRIAEPIVNMRSQVEQMSQDIIFLRERVTDLERRSKTNETAVEEILRGVRSLILTTTTTPAGANPLTGADLQPADDGSALFLSAMRDYSSGKDDRAMEALVQFVNTYPNSPDAPQATYLIGKLYDRAGQNDQALQAFDRVLERYPENSIKPDALFEKAEQLLKMGKKPEALREFQSFVTRYPSNPNVTSVQQRIKDLQTPAAKPAASKSKSRK